MQSIETTLSAPECTRSQSLTVPLVSKRHLPHLDGIRGIAVLLVIFCHAQVRMLNLSLGKLGDWGWTGVDLFFVLSGFLITGILLDSRQSESYFRSFYARRALRILPLYYGILLLSFAVLPVLSALGKQMASSAGPSLLYVFFLQNVFPHARPPLLVVTWSLAVEEQFYILWPLLVFLLPVRWLKRFMLFLFLIIPLVRAFALNHGIHGDYIYFNLFHVDGLALGSVAAILLRETTDAISLRFTGFAAAILGIMICAKVGMAANLHELTSPFIYSGIALFFFGVLLISLSVSVVQRVFSFAPLRFTGKISYCLYLVHYPIMSALSASRKNLTVLGSDLVYLVVAIASSYAVAVASWHLLEQPILRFKNRFEY